MLYIECRLEEGRERREVGNKLFLNFCIDKVRPKIFFILNPLIVPSNPVGPKSTSRIGSHLIFLVLVIVFNLVCLLNNSVSYI